MAGYRELEHIADWELEAWADDLPGLLEQAARGMYALSGVKLQPGAAKARSFTIRAVDPESLLVRFLNELLYEAQQSRLVFDQFRLSLHQPSAGGSMELTAVLEGHYLLSVDKEIKAVTYHNLAVRWKAGALRARVVFDV